LPATLSHNPSTGWIRPLLKKKSATGGFAGRGPAAERWSPLNAAKYQRSVQVGGSRHHPPLKNKKRNLPPAASPDVVQRRNAGRR